MAKKARSTGQTGPLPKVNRGGRHQTSAAKDFPRTGKGKGGKHAMGPLGEGVHSSTPRSTLPTGPGWLFGGRD